MTEAELKEKLDIETQMLVRNVAEFVYASPCKCDVTTCCWKCIFKDKLQRIRSYKESLKAQAA